MVTWCWRYKRTKLTSSTHLSNARTKWPQGAHTRHNTTVEHLLSIIFADYPQRSLDHKYNGHNFIRSHNRVVAVVVLEWFHCDKNHTTSWSSTPPQCAKHRAKKKYVRHTSTHKAHQTVRRRRRKIHVASYQQSPHVVNTNRTATNKHQHTIIQLGCW